MANEYEYSTNIPVNNIDIFHMSESEFRIMTSFTKSKHKICLHEPYQIWNIVIFWIIVEYGHVNSQLCVSVYILSKDLMKVFLGPVEYTQYTQYTVYRSTVRGTEENVIFIESEHYSVTGLLVEIIFEGILLFERWQRRLLGSPVTWALPRLTRPFPPPCSTPHSLRQWFTEPPTRMFRCIHCIARLHQRFMPRVLKAPFRWICVHYCHTWVMLDMSSVWGLRLF